MTNKPCLAQIGDVLEQARRVGITYYKMRRKPLGITGEVSEYEAARLLGLSPGPPVEKAGIQVGGNQSRVCRMTGHFGRHNRKTNCIQVLGQFGQAIILLNFS
jgi:hypothetical protein